MTKKGLVFYDTDNMQHVNLLSLTRHSHATFTTGPN
uniref:Uncharacterized protein n=1 Tax=Anguilla anguilla TaxID=7936 RepID=A0A0E9TJR6_ANGAN